MKNQQQRGRAAVAVLLFLGLSAAAVASWWNWPLIMAEHLAPRVDASGRGSLESLGQFGDMFGALNALFAGAAFLGVAIASYLQFGTLKAAREQQRLSEFEPLFFQLIGLFRELQRDTEINGWVGSPYGLSHHLTSMTIIEELNSAHHGKKLSRNAIFKIRNDLLGEEKQLAPVFNIMEQVMLLVDSSKLRDGLRLRYAEIAMALFSDDFLILTALYCFSKDRTALAAGLLRNGLKSRAAASEVTSGRTQLQLQWLVNVLAEHIVEPSKAA